MYDMALEERAERKAKAEFWKALTQLVKVITVEVQVYLKEKK